MTGALPDLAKAIVSEIAAHPVLAPTPPLPKSPQAAVQLPARTAMVFVTDRDSEGVIRQCLIDLAVPAPIFVNGGVDAAIAALKERASPRLLIVDVHDVEDPVARIRDLANVCDPETGVIVVGEVNDIRVYRGLKASGVVEYYFKPLVRSLVMQTCQAIMTGNTEQAPSRLGRLVFVVSVRGGAGGTTIATNTAWFLAETRKRRVGLIDMDLQYGDAALQFDVSPTHALKEALDHPERVDELFLERAIINVGERLGLMAGLEPLDEIVNADEHAVMSLVELMLRRYRYVFMDISAELAPRLMHLLHLPGTTLLVSTSSLACARDVARWRDKLGPNTAERTTLNILNKASADNGLSTAEFTRAAGAAPDIIIPYASEIATASQLGVRGLQTCTALQNGLVPLLRQLSGEEATITAPSFWQRLWSK
jgi:pilus assembly protein CpaE